MSKMLSKIVNILKPKQVASERPALTESLTSREKVFKIPPLTKELTEWISLIAPHMQLKADEQSRRFFESAQNGCCWGEFDAIQSFLTTLREPEYVLDIGPGLGRSTVFFHKKLAWQNTKFHLYEGNGTTTKYTMNGPRFEDSFCGNIDLLRQLLEYNGMENFEIFNAVNMNYKLVGFPVQYDFIYSFFSVGFHWSLTNFLNEILALMKPNAIGIFTVPDNFVPFPQIDRLQYKVVTYNNVWPAGKTGKIVCLTNAEK